jgi:hypothetical protein
MVLRIHSREGFGITEFRLGKPNSLLLLLPTESYLTTHFGLAQGTSLIEVTNTVRKVPIPASLLVVTGEGQTIPA